MKKPKTKKPESKTTTTPAPEPKAEPTNPAADLAILRLTRIIDQAEHQSAIRDRDETIAQLSDKLNDREDRICELREMVRSLGGVIASV